MANSARALKACACAAFLLPFLASRPVSAETGDVILYHVFLTDGSAVISYGAYTRVGDSLVLSMPLAMTEGTPPLHVVTLPADAVDWDRTERYAQSARHDHYTRTRGEADFSALSGDVARVLSEIARTPDRGVRLQLAEGLRRAVIDWPRRHYAYRAEDVRQFAEMIDAVIAELRAATGERQFDLSFVAVVRPPELEPLLPPPTLQQLIAQALSAARLTEVPAERMSMLQSIIAVLDRPTDVRLEAAWASRTRAAASRALAAEIRTEKAYAAVTRTALTQATAYASRADVRKVESVLRSVRAEDERRGRRRPNEMTALVASLEAKLQEARRLRLEIDRWSLRQKAYRAYDRAVSRPVDGFAALRRWLEDIRSLAGPDASLLGRIDRTVADGLRGLDRTRVPEELASVHELLTQAHRLAGQAADVRRRAILSGEVETAWAAASAASGALMLFERARAELSEALREPQLR